MLCPSTFDSRCLRSPSFEWQVRMENVCRWQSQSHAQTLHMSCTWHGIFYIVINLLFSLPAALIRRVDRKHLLFCICLSRMHIFNLWNNRPHIHKHSLSSITLPSHTHLTHHQLSVIFNSTWKYVVRVHPRAQKRWLLNNLSQCLSLFKSTCFPSILIE